MLARIVQRGGKVNALEQIFNISPFTGCFVDRAATVMWLASASYKMLTVATDGGGVFVSANKQAQHL